MTAPTRTTAPRPAPARDHIHGAFTNPHLICTTCRQPVYGYHLPEPCGCNQPPHALPCGHPDITSLCPTWAEHDECRCVQQLGAAPHGHWAQRKDHS